MNEIIIVVIVQSLSCVQLFVTPWTAACQASLSFTVSLSLLKLMSIETVMPSYYLILCHSLLLFPSIFPSVRVFSNESALHTCISVNTPFLGNLPGDPFQRKPNLICQEKEVILTYIASTCLFLHLNIKPWSWYFYQCCVLPFNLLDFNCFACMYFLDLKLVLGF